MVLLHLQCPAGAPLRYAVCHAACSSSSFLTAAPVSFTKLRSFLPRYASLHHVRSQAICFSTWHPAANTQIRHGRMHSSLRKPTLQYSLGFITLHSSFIHFSIVQSTRCPLLFCSPAAPLKAAFTLRLLIAHVVSPFRKASLRFTCIVQPPPYPDGKFTPAASYGAGIAIRSSWLYCQPLCGGSLSASVHSFLILSGGHLTARQHYSADKCAARLCFFFAAGAFTGRIDTFAIASKKAILIYV